MEKIASFTIDHLRLLRGVYVSRRDTTPGGDVITTFDVRLSEPNRQPAVSPEALHTIEHLAATYLRNRADWSDRIVYWGPMGCCTGSYLLMQGELEPSDILPCLQICSVSSQNSRVRFRGHLPATVATIPSTTFRLLNP